MSAKQVRFGSRPKAQPEMATTPEAWVENRLAEEKQKRMTFDVPESLHKRVKMGCAARGVTIREIILELLEREFPA
jgi:predicted DNA binding CopG/RHH family protein